MNRSIMESNHMSNLGGYAMKHLLAVILSVLVIVASIHIAPSAVQAQSPETAPACDIIYHDMTHYVALPVGCASSPSTPTAPLRDAPDGYTPIPWVVFSDATGEGETSVCLAPVGDTIALTVDHVIYYAPDARAATQWIIPAESTAQQLDTDGSYLEIVWACQVLYIQKE